MEFASVHRFLNRHVTRTFLAKQMGNLICNITMEKGHFEVELHSLANNCQFNVMFTSSPKAKRKTYRNLMKMQFEMQKILPHFSNFPYSSAWMPFMLATIKKTLIVVYSIARQPFRSFFCYIYGKWFVRLQCRCFANVRCFINEDWERTFVLQLMWITKFCIAK